MMITEHINNKQESVYIETLNENNYQNIDTIRLCPEHDLTRLARIDCLGLVLQKVQYNPRHIVYSICLATEGTQSYRLGYFLIINNFQP